ncbi:MAG: N-acetyltransferase [Solirubrobacteraceae bacterium]
MSDRVEPLAARHDLNASDCGQEALIIWLRQHARRATAQGTRTYLLIDEDTEAVAGYYALAPHLLAREDTPRGVGRGAPKRIPAILLAKLALDRSLHGQGLGGELLVQALTTIVVAARSAGGRLIVVDAADQNAASFYRAHDFQPSPTDPHRLIMKLSTAARALELTWP